MAADAHLAELNPEQRRAACHGVADDGVSPPGQALLILAGAGTGKTTTLAHRVAQLILKGADPERILLLTFTRRAAEMMVARAERICAAALGDGSGFAGRLHWAGTFHAVGARLLREHADSIGLAPGFTILDRGDAADLLDMAARSWASPALTAASRKKAPASPSTPMRRTPPHPWTGYFATDFPGARSAPPS